MRDAITMHAIFHEIVSQNIHFVTSVFSFSSILDFSVPGTVCSLILTILHSLELLENCSYTIELISIPTMGPLSRIDYYMTKRTLTELANPYPHTPITMQLSEIPDTTGLKFWCMFKFLHMQFRFGCRSNNCLCNRQPRFTPSKVHTVHML